MGHKHCQCGNKHCGQISTDTCNDGFVRRIDELSERLAGADSKYRAQVAANEALTEAYANKYAELFRMIKALREGYVCPHDGCRINTKQVNDAFCGRCRTAGYGQQTT